MGDAAAQQAVLAPEASVVKIGGDIPVARVGHAMASRYNKPEALQHWLEGRGPADTVQKVIFVDDNSDNVFNMFMHFATAESDGRAPAPRACAVWYPPPPPAAGEKSREEHYDETTRELLTGVCRGELPPMSRKAMRMLGLNGPESCSRPARVATAEVVFSHNFNTRRPSGRAPTRRARRPALDGSPSRTRHPVVPISSPTRPWPGSGVCISEAGRRAAYPIGEQRAARVGVALLPHRDLHHVERARRRAEPRRLGRGVRHVVDILAVLLAGEWDVLGLRLRRRRRRRRGSGCGCISSS